MHQDYLVANYDDKALWKKSVLRKLVECAARIFCAHIKEELL